MDMSCYCISHKDVRSESDEPSSSMDAALHELGMLSRITDSRKEYLKEKIKKKRSSNSLSAAPLCVVQMNSKFITKFSLSKNLQTQSDSEEEKTDTKPYLCVQSEEFEPRRGPFRPSSRYWRKISREKPYDPCFRKRVAAQSSYIPVAATDEDGASPPSVSRQDSGNKSNPSSPVKSQNSLPAASGSSIVRSRSLDDLEIAKVEDSKEDCYCRYGRSDIETVSQRISNLHSFRNELRCCPRHLTMVQKYEAVFPGLSFEIDPEPSPIAHSAALVRR